MFFLPKATSAIDGFKIEAYIYRKNIAGNGSGAHMCKDFYVALYATCTKETFYGPVGTYQPILIVPLIQDIVPNFTGDAVLLPVAPHVKLHSIELTDEERDNTYGVWANIETLQEGARHIDVTSFLIRGIGAMQ